MPGSGSCWRQSASSNDPASGPLADGDLQGQLDVDVVLDLVAEVASSASGVMSQSSHSTKSPLVRRLVVRGTFINVCSMTPVDPAKTAGGSRLETLLPRSEEQ